MSNASDMMNAKALLGSLDIPDRVERARVRRAARAWLNEIADGRRITSKVYSTAPAKAPPF